MSNNVFDIGFIAVILIAFVVRALSYVWLWRGRSLLGRRSETPLEERRRQILRDSKHALPSAGILVALAADRALDLWHLPRIQHAYWGGFKTAVLLFSCALIFFNFVVGVYESRVEQRPRNLGRA